MAMTHSFPILEVDDLIDTFKVWSFSVSPEQLKRPTPEFVETVSLACLKQFTELSPDSFRDWIRDTLQSRDDGDMYSSTLNFHITVYHLQRMASIAHIDGFSIKDLTHPTRERTAAVFSGFINLIRHAETGGLHDKLEEFRKRSAGLHESRENATANLEGVLRKIKIRKDKLLQDEPRCKQLREQIREVKNNILSTKGKTEPVIKQVEELREEKTRLVKRKVALHAEIRDDSDSISRTRQRIVQSPERIKRTISTMGSTAMEDKRALAMHEANVRDLNAKMVALSNIEKDVRGCYEQLQTIQKESELLAETQKQLLEVKDTYEEKQIAFNDNKLKLQRVANQLSNAEDKRKRAERHKEEKHAASQRTIDRLQREYQEMSHNRRKNDEELEELHAEADKVQSQMADHLKKSEAEINELVKEYWRLRHGCDVYMETLAGKLNITVD